mgnify:CR=1 FL=1
MSDFYGHSGATQISNQLGQQSLDMNERRIGNWEDKTIAYRQLNAQDQAKQSTDVKNSAEADLVAVPKIFKTAQTIGKAGQAAYVGISRGIAQGQSNLALAQRGARASGAVLSEAGMGSKIFGEGAVALKDITGVEGIVRLEIYLILRMRMGPSRKRPSAKTLEMLRQYLVAFLTSLRHSQAEH